MTAVRIQNLCKTFSKNKENLAVLRDLSLDIPADSFTVILGRSGCGKTTLLRIIAGLETPSLGKVSFNTPHPKTGFVFQEARLMPWLTVEENLSFLRPDIPAEELQNILHLLNLKPFAHFYPAELSGGMAQKTSIGRALCYQPDIILMDEPFASLDYFTRSDLQQELLHIFDNFSKTIIFVTHHIEEAILLADNIVILKEGRAAHVLNNTDDRNERDLPSYQTTLKQKILSLL